MSHMRCPTVRIQAGDSFIVINESDFSHEQGHELYAETGTFNEGHVRPEQEPTPFNEGTVGWYKVQLDAARISYPDDVKKEALVMIYNGFRHTDGV